MGSLLIITFSVVKWGACWAGLINNARHTKSGNKLNTRVFTWLEHFLWFIVRSLIKDWKIQKQKKKITTNAAAAVPRSMQLKWSALRFPEGICTRESHSDPVGVRGTTAVFYVVLVPSTARGSISPGSRCHTSRFSRAIRKHETARRPDPTWGRKNKNNTNCAFEGQCKHYIRFLFLLGIQ